jgi:2-polyprenyl-6-methoxyphenol hydroxylase-like FAD-dependent oxidoreductase
MQSIQTQVIIAGAGPTGLMLAAQLQRYGISFVIFDKNEGTSPLSKAMVVQARSLEILDEMGLADKAIAIGQQADHFSMIARGKVRGRVSLRDFGKGLSPFPFALILEQSKTERLLAEYVRAKSDIMWRTDMARIEQSQDRVTVFCKKDGEAFSIGADYLVGCDGASSFVRHYLGFGFKGETQERMFYVADVKLQSRITDQTDAYFAMIKRGFVLFFPLAGPKHYRVIGTVPAQVMSKPEIHFGDIKSIIAEQLGIPVSFPEEYWFSTYKVHSRMAETFYKGRCFIAGDAAHIHTPAGGQGMNTGLQDSYNLAWKLALVMQKKAGPDLLATYDFERRQNAKNLLKTTDRIFDILAGTGFLSNFFRLYVMPFVIRNVINLPYVSRRFFPLLSQIGIKYPDSPLTVDSKMGKVSAGDRMPYFETDGKSIFKELAFPGYKAVWFGTGQAPFEFEGIPIVAVPAVPPVFGTDTNFAVVLRPDNHIAYIGKDFGQMSRVLKTA